jgi:hypothetical protein
MRGTDDLFELQSGQQWTDYTNHHALASTYCQASNEVGAWIAEHGGFAAVLNLLTKRAWGTPFYSLYGRKHELLAAPAPVPRAARDSSS